jgi:chromosome partitioning protein
MYTFDMHTIAVVSEKGGVGKTTISLDIAVAAGRRGKLAAVLDIDPQATASTWTDRRAADVPWVVATPARRLDAAISNANRQGVELIVIDTAPHSSMDAAAAAKLADLVVVPVEPHRFSLDTVEKAADLLRGMAGDPLAVFVVNKAPVQGSESASAVAYITGLGLRVAPVILYMRAAHRHAGNVGKVAAEFAADSKAATEAQELYNYLFTLLKGSKNGKD